MNFETDLARRLNTARNWAATCHEEAGQRYGPDPYVVHLDQVRSVAFEFGVIDHEILVATLLHDIVEDTPVELDQVALAFGPKVAALVDAVTDPPGYPNRKVRKAAAYPRILSVPGATKLKLADRIANVRSCWRVAEMDKRNKSLLGMYKKEYGGFRKALRPNDADLAYDQVEKAMWDELDRLLAWTP